jgi:thiol-disulfide isomerase/thioredoxin
MARVKMSEKIAKMKTEQPAPDFKVVDLNGKEVSLSSLRGKTVILDFWATWCQPCVASFPGMQKAVNFYRKDTSIVFMFIHTLEKNDHAVADVKKFMSFKKYKFDVYMDLKNPESHKNEAVSAYGVRGIPAKFIIDKSGVIRYKNAGYISEEEAIPEIRAMLESIN